jgi:hypothetical protein
MAECASIFLRSEEAKTMYEPYQNRNFDLKAFPRPVRIGSLVIIAFFMILALLQVLAPSGSV